MSAVLLENMVAVQGNTTELPLEGGVQLSTSRSELIRPVTVISRLSRRSASSCDSAQTSDRSEGALWQHWDPTEAA